VSANSGAATAGIFIGIALARILSFQLNRSILVGDRARNLVVALRLLPGVQRKFTDKLE
jgi:hypothetical protein